MTSLDPYQRIIDVLSTRKRVLITTHARPDGDALGSTAALHLALRHIGVASEILLLTHLPGKYAFVYTEAGVTHHDAETGWPEALDLSKFDALLVIDTGTWSQLPGLRERVGQIAGPKIVIDHHLTQEDWADEKLVVKDAAAACEIVAELLSRWPVALDRATATALYVGIVSDTGWFMHSNTRPQTLRLAAALVEAGVDADAIYQRLYQMERAERIKLQARALMSLSLPGDARVAIMRLGPDDFAATGAKVTDTEAIVNVPLQIRTVEISALLVESPEPGPIRVSLRSKGQIDCAALAATFGGGGHARAAGIKLDGSLESAGATIEAAILAKFRPIDASRQM